MEPAALAVVEAEPDARAEPEEYVERLAMHYITKAWGSKVVLDDVELILEAGTLTWIGGQNGAGKTTLMRIAAGLIAPDDGIVDLDGLHPRRDRGGYQNKVGFVSAGDRGLYARLTVAQHLELWGRLALLRGERYRRAIDVVTEKLALDELLGKRVDRISMGQRQRVRLSMAFLHDPDVVLLDEPLNSLDERGADLLRACIADVCSRGGAALWCSPGTDRNEAPFDAHLWLEDGKLTEARPR